MSIASHQRCSKRPPVLKQLPGAFHFTDESNAKFHETLPNISKEQLTSAMPLGINCLLPENCDSLDDGEAVSDWNNWE